MRRTLEPLRRLAPFHAIAEMRTAPGKDDHSHLQTEQDRLGVGHAGASTAERGNSARKKPWRWSSPPNTSGRGRMPKDSRTARKRLGRTSCAIGFDRTNPLKTVESTPIAATVASNPDLRNDRRVSRVRRISEFVNVSPPSRVVSGTDHHLRRSGTTTLASGACATPSDCDVWRVCPGTAGEPSNRRLAGVGTRSGAEGRTRKVPLASSPLPASLLRALHSGASAMSDLRAVSLWFVHFSFARRRRLRRANAVLRLDSGLALTGPNPTPLPCGFRVERFASVAALHPVARALAGRCTIALQRR